MEAKLIDSREIAPGVRHFEFEAVGVERLDFVPGQFTSFTDVIDGKEITRAYSLANAPSGTNRFELCLNRVEPGHLSPRLFDMKPGDRMQMRQPLGMFVLRQPPRDSIFIATGTGIAPFRSILYRRTWKKRGRGSRCCSGCVTSRICCTPKNSKKWPAHMRTSDSGRPSHVRTQAGKDARAAYRHIWRKLLARHEIWTSICAA